MSYTAFEGEKGYRENEQLQGKTFGEVLSDKEKSFQAALDQQNGEKPEWVILEEKRIQGMKKALQQANDAGKDIRSAVLDTLPPGTFGEANLESGGIKLSTKLVTSKEKETLETITEQADLLATTAVHEATHLHLAGIDKKQTSRSTEIVEGVTQMMTNNQVSEGQKFDIYSAEVASVQGKLAEHGSSPEELIQAIRSNEQKKVISILDTMEGKAGKPTEE